MFSFLECPTCAMNHQTVRLCAACLNNRSEMRRLAQLIPPEPTPFEPQDQEEFSVLEKVTYRYIANLAQEITRQNKACFKKNKQINKLRALNKEQRESMRIQANEICAVRTFMLNIAKDTKGSNSVHILTKVNQLLTADYSKTEVDANEQF